ncbi:phosphoribosylamine--glycine ligase [Helicobacter marmotae]|uniref:Phosphoribosylamine--glycine ligase n=1 Tax=Helicobacter marmotae TaxID=152490 RepID=A0A3D8I324_9HELI|nr:phosphoribosylamine--glycine ligase [Helicobacter marmotae]RDU59560.1 phosphoribosylamine--glycine ligase [Helicobacter marmotae]
MQERILIIGNGGREYAMGLALKQDSRIAALYFAPGNGGTSQLGSNLSYKGFKELLELITLHHITLVIIGPEAPLGEGLSDELRAHNIRTFAPSKKAARLELSKAYMKDFVSKIDVPTARYMQSSDFMKLSAFIDTLSAPIVIKADGLCAGKGVIIAKSQEEAKSLTQDMLSGKAFGEAGKCVVIEEFLEGYELSVFAICDGQDYILLPACQDHKRLLSGDKGPNTGGMGAYTPTPLCDEYLLERISHTIISPTLKAMKEQGSPFQGVLFAGIMVVEKNGEPSPYLLEFNVRFGDPECEVLMPLLQTPLLDVITYSIEGRIKDLECQFKEGFAVAVVACSKDYPYASSASVPITIGEFEANLGHIVYAGVSYDEQKGLMANGGRVLLAVGLAHSIKQARDNAYKILQSVSFEGMQFRDDIAHRVLHND